MLDLFCCLCTHFFYENGENAADVEIARFRPPIANGIFASRLNGSKLFLIPIDGIDGIDVERSTGSKKSALDSTIVLLMQNNSAAAVVARRWAIFAGSEIFCSKYCKDSAINEISSPTKHGLILNCLHKRDRLRVTIHKKRKMFLSTSKIKNITAISDL